MTSKMKPASLDVLREKFADALQENALLANYTTARVGGLRRNAARIHPRKWNGYSARRNPGWFGQ